MLIGCVREIKGGENRVGLTPAGAAALAGKGHEVLVEKGAGAKSGFPDQEYERAGARILPAAEVFASADLIVKVKEPQPAEFPLFREGQVLFTYLHLAPERSLTQFLLERKIAGIAYETVEDQGELPLLTPMSEVAGRMAVQVGAHYLERTQGGAGKLLGGVPGVPPAKVVIIGTGVVGMNACTVAFGMGAEVSMVGRNLAQLRRIDDLYQGGVRTLAASPATIERAVREADLVVGAVLLTGAAAPRLVSRQMVRQMRPGSVVVDVAIDQGGCIETIRPTTHQDPVYVEEGVIHYGVTNMPGAVPHTSTLALTNATLPYLLEIARWGVPDVFRKSSALLKGLNTYQGELTNQGVAEALGLPCQEPGF
ncbi:MAG: alanine dehydrogenase [Candidatus Aenigmarchaeota archaeon]|nr:alanine dehydrogenase [Candidatus Aenigmarchaeota archaeon]